MNGNMTFAVRIKKFREARGESQADVANLVGYQKQAVSHWENNGKVPRSAALAILAKHYQTTSDYLLGFNEKHGTDTGRIAFDISSEEIDLIRQYRSMEENQKDVVKKVVATIAPFKINQGEKE